MPATSQESDAFRRPSVLQSPWYWAYVFCAAGLAAMVLLGGKFSERQAQIERQSQGRQRAAEASREGAHASLAELSTPDSTTITLTPLYAILIAALVASWGLLWKTHFRRRPAPPPSPREAL